MDILGIDEAGRGSVIGPLVIAGVIFKSNDSKKLKKVGVKDSKLLTKNEREKLFKTIKKIATSYKIIKIKPNEIDQRFSVNTNLNQIEAIKFAEIINSLKPDLAIIDTPTKNTENFKSFLKRFLSCKCKIKCENYADRKYVEVGAASILAKVIRDKEIEGIEEEIGEKVGIGYPSDPMTINFIEKALKNKEWLKKYVRKSWLTFQRIKGEKEQKKLFDWDDR